MVATYHIDLIPLTPKFQMLFNLHDILKQLRNTNSVLTYAFFPYSAAT